MPLTLLTGAPGWLGIRLLQVFVAGLPDVSFAPKPEAARRIRCLVKPGEDVSTLRKISEHIEIVVGDLRDQDSVRFFCKDAASATLFHCAGVVHPALFIRELYDVNVAGTRNLLAAAEEVGVQRVIAVSSNSPIGVSYQPEHLFDEQSPYRPYMNYGRSKMLMERVVHEYQSRGKLQTVILRPAWFYGPY